MGWVLNLGNINQVEGIFFPLPPTIRLLPQSASYSSSSAITFRVKLADSSEVLYENS